MKRRPRILLILLLLVAGAIVNVAVAWGFAMFVLPPSNVIPLLDQSHWWDTHPRGGENVLAAWRWSTRGFEMRVMCAGDPGAVTIISTNSIVVRSKPATLVELSTAISTGWPSESLGGESWMNGVAPRSAINLLHSGSWPGGVSVWAIEAKPLWQRGSSGGVRVIPLRPIWPGFAINTAFYAFILWLLFSAPFALRRRMRIERGLCPKCAYPVGTNAVCTECGAAVRARPERGDGI